MSHCIVTLSSRARPAVTPPSRKKSARGTPSRDKGRCAAFCRTSAFPLSGRRPADGQDKAVSTPRAVFRCARFRLQPDSGPTPARLRLAARSVPHVLYPRLDLPARCDAPAHDDPAAALVAECIARAGVAWHTNCKNDDENRWPSTKDQSQNVCCGGLKIRGKKRGTSL